MHLTQVEEAEMMGVEEVETMGVVEEMEEVAMEEAVCWQQ